MHSEHTLAIGLLILLLLSACASTSPVPRPTPVQAPPTATTASNTEWPETIEGRWVKISESTAGSGVYIDRENFVRDHGKGGSAWVRIYDKSQAYIQLDEEFVCRGWKLRTTRWTSYDRQGGVISNSQGEPTKWGNPAPGTIAEGLMEVLCPR